MTIKRELAALLAKETGLTVEDVESILEVPPQAELGDYAFPCYSLAQAFRKAPGQIANDIAGKLHAPFLSHVKAAGPYVNCFFKIDALAEESLSSAHPPFKVPAVKHEVICIESPSPNTNKPLHLGHVRNMLLGTSIRALLERRGHRLYSLDLVNDRGVHICKSMLAYEMARTTDTPESTGIKGDHFVGKYYVKFAKAAAEKPELEVTAQTMLQQWEANNPHVRALWKQMRDWCLAGFAQTYNDFGVSIDKAYYESEIYLDGKQIVADGLAAGIFKKDEKGAVYADIPVQGPKYVQRADGTSIYITQDIALAKKRFDEYHMDRLVYVVGSEQIHHFKALFSIFSQLGYSFGSRCHHLAYGMIYLPEGKMKSREGTVVDADDLRNEMIELARAEIVKRSPDLDAAEADRRAIVIAMGALRFYVLKYAPNLDFTYDPKESISFQGETGPYVQYTYARISSIFRKAGKVNLHAADATALTEMLEKQLLSKVATYRKVISEAADHYRPSLVAMYALELSQLANTYYHDTMILVEDERVKLARLKLLDAVREVLKDALSLLGIDVLEEM